LAALAQSGLTMAARYAKPHAGGRRASEDHRNRIEATRQFYAAARGPQTDPRIGFIDAMRSAGITASQPDRIIADGSLHRFHVEGDKHGTHNGWAVLRADRGGAGAFGHWRTHQSFTWHGGRERLSSAAHARMKAAFAEAKRIREAETRQRWEQAGDAAQAFWQSAAPAHAAHPYLVRKQVNAYGIRQWNRLLLIPLRDGDGVLWNVQTIDESGSKLFRKGGRKTGLYHAIGGEVIDVLHIAAGYATAASIRKATRQPVAVAFDRGNLEPVARVLRAKFPQARIVICADNDVNTAGNPGLSRAQAAASAIRGFVAIPPEPHNDFNDAAREVPQ
jgi:putative DNA primase/helicase